MDEIKKWSFEEYQTWLQRDAAPYQAGYFAMYSSLLDGIVTHPNLMTIPIDDHLAHRGDGVFETLKCISGALYNLEKHQARLFRSAEKINLDPPFSRDAIAARIIQTVRAGGKENCLVRVLLSRGPGGFSVNPYESIGTQLYIIAYADKGSFMKSHPQGATAALSDIPGKPSFFATIKTCNYLPNALMKKQAVDKQVDFIIGVDERGYITEGPTENLCIVTQEGTLVRPPDDYILNGTTMQRGMALAKELGGVETRTFTPDEVKNASEVLIFGTSTDATAVIEFEGDKIGDGTPGPYWSALSKKLCAEINHDEHLRTPVF